METINIPNIKNVAQLTRFINSVRGNFENSQVTLDFGNYNFIKPYHIAPIACLLDELLLLNNEIHFSGMGEKLESYLSTIGLLSFSDKNYNHNQMTGFPQEKTYLKLWKVSSESITAYKSYAIKFYAGLLQGQNLDIIDIGLAEIFNNIIDHSKSNISGYIITQLYEEKNELIISICDFGLGIPSKINEYLVDKGCQAMSDSEALTKATELGYSTKTEPHNKGMGLTNLKDFIIDCKSSLKIISNNAIYIIDNEGFIQCLDNMENFHGTMVVIKVDTLKLPPIEELVEEEAYL